MLTSRRSMMEGTGAEAALVNKGEHEIEIKTQDGVAANALRFCTFAVMGLVFGAAFERSHVYEPDNIRQQFVFSKYVTYERCMCPNSLTVCHMASTLVRLQHAVQHEPQACHVRLGWSTLGDGDACDALCAP